MEGCQDLHGVAVTKTGGDPHGRPSVLVGLVHVGVEGCQDLHGVAVTLLGGGNHGRGSGVILVGLIHVGVEGCQECVGDKAHEWEHDNE